MVTKARKSFNLEHLGMAYRKAKVDLYYSTHANIRDVVEYEENIRGNLEDLLEKLNGKDETWVAEGNFVGSWIAAPAGFTIPQSDSSDSKNQESVLFSSPAKQWQHTKKSGDNQRRGIAQFRVMAKPSLGFHVLSALWIMKVGAKFDACLKPCAYGNRLRRTKSKQFNTLSLGSFQPYLKPYRDWRDDGISAMRAALETGKNVAAVTADVSSFYHRLDPVFMLDETFIRNVCALELSETEEKLHRLFISALSAWAKTTPLGKGLPVGLPASAVIANLALLELDRLIERQVVPVYYGRYVDDIILVVENNPEFSSLQDLWGWLIKRSDGMLSRSNQSKSILFSNDYLQNSHIEFSSDKNKLFILEGDSGLTMLESIEKHISDRASEWRSMPDLRESEKSVTTSIVEALTNDGDHSDNLRKTDKVSTRRAAFAMLLRDFEAYERDLPPASWREQRGALYKVFKEQVLVLPCFFDMANFLPRVVRLATACEDYSDLKFIFIALDKLVATVEADCDICLKGTEGSGKVDIQGLIEYLDSWRSYLSDMVRDNIISAFPARLSHSGSQDWRQHFTESKPAAFGSVLSQVVNLSTRQLQKDQARYFSHDLAHYPFRFIGLPPELFRKWRVPARKSIVYLPNSKEFITQQVQIGVTQLSSWIRLTKSDALPIGLVFSTRPYSLPETYIVANKPFERSNQQPFKDVILALRGYELSTSMPVFNDKCVLEIPDENEKNLIRVALASWKTLEDSWVAAVTRRPDPDTTRYRRLMLLIDSVLKQNEHIDYLVMPELSLPPAWFMRLSHKLLKSRISLIAGIEYSHARKRKVRNQVWAALTHNGPGFPSMMIYRQDKQCPAIHEERELERLAHVILKPEIEWKTHPPILQHGGFTFAILVCSELTNIHYRSALSGKIDALFVPQWNTDTESFNSLVESAALDIHAFIVQCNNLQYGDSRIRAPYKNPWLRDVVRIRGGILDYCVVGEIDKDSLRRFQSSFRSPDGPFKPVPDGYDSSFERKTLPSGSSET